MKYAILLSKGKLNFHEIVLLNFWEGTSQTIHFNKILWKLHLEMQLQKIINIVFVKKTKEEK